MTTRTCGNCCYCKSRDVYDTSATCAMTHKLTYKGKTAEELKCKHHLFRETSPRSVK